MRFRSFGVSASNMEEYISELKRKEEEYIEESTLSHLNTISLEQIFIQDDDDNDNDDYALLGHKSNYRIQKNNLRKKKRKIQKNKFNKRFRKKINFFHCKRKRINSEPIYFNI